MKYFFYISDISSSITTQLGNIRRKKSINCTVRRGKKFIRILVWINLAELDCRIEKICHQLDSSTQAKYEQVRHKNKCYDFWNRILRTLKKSSLITKIMMMNFKDITKFYCEPNSMVIFILIEMLFININQFSDS